MTAQDAFQPLFVEVSLFQELFDARFVFLSSNTGSDGDDMLGTEDFCGHTLECDALGFTHGFFGQSAGCKELYQESAYHKMLFLDLPTLRLQVRVDVRNACGQPRVFWDEKNVGVVGSERLDIVNGRECAAERPV